MRAKSLKVLLVESKKPPTGRWRGSDSSTCVTSADSGGVCAKEKRAVELVSTCLRLDPSNQTNLHSPLLGEGEASKPKLAAAGDGMLSHAGLGGTGGTSSASLAGGGERGVALSAPRLLGGVTGLRAAAGARGARGVAGDMTRASFGEAVSLRGVPRCEGGVRKGLSASLARLSSGVAAGVLTRRAVRAPLELTREAEPVQVPLCLRSACASLRVCVLKRTRGSRRRIAVDFERRVRWRLGLRRQRRAWRARLSLFGLARCGCLVSNSVCARRREDEDIHGVEGVRWGLKNLWCKTSLQRCIRN